MCLSLESKYRLAAVRAERLYTKSDSAGMSYGPRRVHVNLDNVHDADKGAFVFHFGAYGCTYVLTFGSLEDALEDAAATLKEVAPGCFTEPDYESAKDEIMGDTGEGDDMITDDAIAERAETDLTYTESGYIASWEWTVTEMHSPADVLAFVRGDR